MVTVLADDTAKVPQVRVVHADEVIVILIILLRDLDSPFAVAGDAVLRKLLSGRRVDRVANTIPDLFCAGGSGGDVEVGGETRLGDQVLHYEFGHGAAADIAVANEKYF